jgi:outer membrane protein TolC
MFLFLRRIIFIHIVLFSVAFNTKAQQREYSLLQLVTAAQNHLPLLQQDQSLINSARAFAGDVRTEAYLPQMQFNYQVNGGTDNSLAGSILPIGINPSVSGGITSANNAQMATGSFVTLYSQYELFDFGLKRARINNANSFVDLQNTVLQKDAYSVTNEVCRLYFQLLKYKFKSAADSENVQHYADVLTVIRALTGSGLKPGSDSSLASAELSAAKVLYTQTLGNVQAVKQQLAYLTGVPARTIEADTSALRSFYPEKPDASLMSDSLSQNPFIDYINRQKDVFVTNQSVINRSYLPKLFIAAGAWARGSSIQYNNNFEALNEGFGYQRYNYLAGFSLTYDLFNEARRNNALLQEKSVLVNQVVQADNQMAVYAGNLRELPNQLQSAAAVFDETLAQYKAGIINIVNVTNAAFVLYRSKTDYIEALCNWYLALTDKASANGTLNTFIQTIK